MEMVESYDVGSISCKAVRKELSEMFQAYEKEDFGWHRRPKLSAIPRHERNVLGNNQWNRKNKRRLCRNWKLMFKRVASVVKQF